MLLKFQNENSTHKKRSYYATDIMNTKNMQHASRLYMADNLAIKLFSFKSFVQRTCIRLVMTLEINDCGSSH